MYLGLSALDICFSIFTSLNELLGWNRGSLLPVSVNVSAASFPQVPVSVNVSGASFPQVPTCDGIPAGGPEVLKVNMAIRQVVSRLMSKKCW